MAKVFISHATEDRAFVENELVPELQQLGIEIWYSRTDIRAGTLYERSIREGLNSSEWFLVVVSPSSARSEWVQDELAWAMDHRPHNRIVPVLLQGGNLNDFHIRLPRIQYVDYVAGSETGRSQLRAICWTGTASPS